MQEQEQFGHTPSVQVMWLDGGSARWELDETRRVMSARRGDRQKLILHRGSPDRHRFTDLGDERVCGVLCEDDPVQRLNVIIVVRTMQRQMLIGQ